MLVRAYFALTVAAFSFATNWIVGRGLAEDVPPSAVAFWRWSFALLLLAPVAIGPLWRDRAIIAAHWRILVFLGVMGAGVFQVLVYWGLRYTTATNGALLNAALPILIAVFSAVLFRQRLAMRMVAGIGISIVGVVLLIVRGDWNTLARLDFNIGDLLVFAAIAIWAIYSIGLKWRPKALSERGFLGAIFVIGVVSTGMCAGVEWLAGYRGHYTPLNWLRLAWLGLFPSLIAYVCWNYGVARIGAARAGVFSHLIPVFAALLAITLLGERLHLYHLVGFALVLGGIVLGNRGEIHQEIRDDVGAASRASLGRQE